MIDRFPQDALGNSMTEFTKMLFDNVFEHPEVISTGEEKKDEKRMKMQQNPSAYDALIELLEPGEIREDILDTEEDISIFGVEDTQTRFNQFQAYLYALASSLPNNMKEWLDWLEESKSYLPIDPNEIEGFIKDARSKLQRESGACVKNVSNIGKESIEKRSSVLGDVRVDVTSCIAFFEGRSTPFSSASKVAFNNCSSTAQYRRTTPGPKGG